MLPELEIAHFAGMYRLVLRGNSIDDDGLLDLCDCLVSAHNTTLRELDLSETQIADRGIEALIETMRCIERIVVVEIEGCREISQEMRDKLDAALRRNKMQSEKLDKMDRLKAMRKAGEKRDEYDEMGLNYVGKDQIQL